MTRTLFPMAPVVALLLLLVPTSPAAAAGHWECRAGAWVGVGGPTHPRPLRACGDKPAVPRSEADCLRAGGTWRRIGIAPGPSCAVPTRDGGRICGDGGECEGLCLAAPTPDQRRSLAAGLAVPLVGKCTTRRPVYGCMYPLVKGRVGRGICRD